MSKKVFIFITFIVVFFGLAFAKVKKKSFAYSNDINIVGINEKSFLISYYEGIKNYGKGDIRYQYVIFDYKKNSVVESTPSRYIAQLYGEECILTDWEDKKYSYTAYYEFFKNEIDNIDKFYTISNFPYYYVHPSQQTFKIISRKPKGGLLEDLVYSIDFILDSKRYNIEKNEANICLIKGINIFAIYNVNEMVLVVLQKEHKGFEEDDYFDFEILGLPKN